MPKYVQAHLTCMLKIYEYEYIYIYGCEQILSMYLPRRLEAAPARADEMVEDCTRRPLTCTNLMRSIGVLVSYKPPFFSI